MPKFNVLCRIDAYADYVAMVQARTPRQAARIAQERHGALNWEHNQTQEFDARLYVTLDDDGREIEATQIEDF